MTPEHPFWRGAFWAVWPPLPRAPGLNMARGSELRLALVWTPASAGALRRLAADREVRAALDRAPPPGAAALVLGGMRAPVLWPDGAVDTLCRRGAERLAEAFLTMAPDLAGLLPAGLDPATARVIAGHELIWHLADRLWPGGTLPGGAVFLRPARV